MMLESVMAIFGLGFLAGMLVAAFRQVQLEERMRLRPSACRSCGQRWRCKGAPHAYQVVSYWPPVRSGGGVVSEANCDICGRPATVVRPETKNRDLAFYCDYDAKRSLGWGDTFHRLDLAEAEEA